MEILRPGGGIGRHAGLKILFLLKECGFDSRIAFVDIDEGAVLPDHSHFNEQTLNVLEGELELKVDGKTLSVKQGESLILAPDVVHGGVAKTACKVIDVFVPRRDDWIDDQRSN